MRRVFADTFYWLALANPADQWRSLIREAIPHLGTLQIVTTEEVLIEFLTGMAGLGTFQRSLAVRMTHEILADLNTLLIPQTHNSFFAGLTLYESRLDKRYSLTDCISMQTCRNESIQEVLTNDHHFTQEGFTILFPR